MQPIKLKILGIPTPKQSVKVGLRTTKTGQTFLHHYQPEKIKQKEMNFAFDVKSQLPKGFKPFRSGIMVKATFIFPPLKNFTQKKLKELESGAKMYKTTRPDLQDNLMKLTMDALNGIVFTDDSLIAKVESEKIFGFIPCIELEFQEL